MKAHRDGSLRGSLTVEAVLIVPIIIFVMFWLINIAFVLYQYAALQAIANQTVEVAQTGWDNTAKDIQTGRLEESRELRDEDIYWGLWDRYQPLKVSSLKVWALKKAGKDPVMDIFTGTSQQDNLKIEVSIENNIGLRRSITVRITDDRRTLFSPVRSMFGFDRTNRVTVASRGTLQDPAELIRNLDWGAELYSEYMKNNPEGAVADATRKITEIREKCITVLK